MISLDNVTMLGREPQMQIDVCSRLLAALDSNAICTWADQGLALPPALLEKPVCWSG
jgi:hypothetical protein